MQPRANQLCPLCGGANHCSPAVAGQFEVECWCARVTIPRETLERIPADQVNQACLCPRCAAGLTAHPEQQRG